MSHDPLGTPPVAAGSPWITPRNLLIAGGVAAGLALLMTATLREHAVPLRVGLILTALVLAMLAVNRRLRAAPEEVEERAVSAGYLALASFVALVALLACDEAWDSFRLLLGVLLGVGLAAAVLILLPQLVRRAIIVLLVAVHFVGILTAVFSVPPPNGVPCWTTGALWTYFYRPYLQFMYLNNAYHFYSPEPGPASQLWFYVKYEDPTDPNLKGRWVEIPRRQDYSSKLLYTRYLAMTESTVQNRFGLPPDYATRQGHRSEARVTLGIPYPIGFQSDQRLLALPDASQYNEPVDLTAKKYVASYARHVARDPKSLPADHPEARVASVKVYRVRHRILTPAELARGEDPNGESLLDPVYVGEFDPDGNLLDPDDPMLYWLFPTYVWKDPLNPNKGIEPKNFVQMHAERDSKKAPAGKEPPGKAPAGKDK
jgi:hypothetical protein